MVNAVASDNGHLFKVLGNFDANGLFTQFVHQRVGMSECK